MLLPAQLRPQAPMALAEKQLPRLLTTYMALLGTAWETFTSLSGQVEDFAKLTPVGSSSHMLVR